MFNIFKKLRTTSSDMNTQQKMEYAVNVFRLIIISCIFAHAIYCLMFLLMKILFLVYFNIGSILLYSVLYLQIAKKRYLLIALFIYIEVSCFSAISTIMLGWDYGFMYLIVCLIGTCFYCPFKKDLTPYIFCTAEIMLFICVRVYTLYANSNSAYGINADVQHQFFILNTCFSFIMMLLTSGMNTASINLTQSALIKKNNDLQYLVNTDPLTNLLNRRGMFRILEETMENSKKKKKTFSIIIGDIDDFKKVNDTYGHDCGDFILKQISQTICSYTRNEDYVCRWGGEEILILFSDTNAQDAYTIINRIRMIIDDTTFSYYDKDLSITMTFGICDSMHDFNLNKIIMEADKCLYEGKRTGKNRVVVS